MSELSLLIVDDDPLSRRLLLKILNGAGVSNVTESENGEAGILALENADAPFDAVFCDIDMPGINGWEFVRKVRFGVVERYKTIPIYMLTARGSEENTQKASYHKISGYILKPPRKDLIAEALVEIEAAKVV